MLQCIKAILLIAFSAVLVACSPTGMLNALTPADTYVATTDIRYGSDPRRKLDVYRPRKTEASPRTFLGAAASDDVVNPERNSLALEQKLRAAGVPVALKIYPDAGPVTLTGAFARPLRNMAPVLDDVVAFVNLDPANRNR